MTTEGDEPLRNAVFIDTSAFFAAFNDNDGQHRFAAPIFDRLLLDEHRSLVTSNIVLVETHAMLLKKVGRAVAFRVLTDLYRGAVRIVRVTEDDERHAREILRRYDDKDFSYADATNFVVMERLGIAIAFSFDRDFAQYGFQVMGLNP